jgi:two-component system, NtrC family, sensor kinase
MASTHRTGQSPSAGSSTAVVTGLGLRGRIILILLVVSILPLAVVGIGSGVVFGTLLENKALELQRSTVRTHATTVDLYLAERVRALDLAARTHRREELADDANLRRLFDRLQEIHDRSLVDLGVIDASGKHLAYVGPYNLRSKNYAEAPWFRHVMAHGSYVSDVFLGYRNVPHCVIAIRRDDDRGPWILRATINSQRLDALVGAGTNTNGYAAFVVNTEGLYQTSPPVGAILDASGIRDARAHLGVRDERLQVDGRDVVQVTAWVNDGRWMLVVRQSAESIRAPVREAMQRGASVTAVAVMLLVITTVLATRHLTGKIDRANAHRDQLSRELLRSSKLASVGELATGLAHEINNPLAVISAERTNLLDCISTMQLSEQERGDLGESMARIGRQVGRCAGITARMLKFGRNKESQPRPTELAGPIHEVTRMMEKQARVRNVTIRTQLDDELPRVVVDATEFEQVLVNLINNAFHAMPEGGTLDIEAHSDGQETSLSVRDSGRGISPENLERVFEPFFTTKPVGEGTGLGLSVCYGIVRGWGGELRINSEVNVGTAVTLILPVVASPEDERQIAR